MHFNLVDIAEHAFQAAMLLGWWHILRAWLSRSPVDVDDDDDDGGFWVNP